MTGNEATQKKQWLDEYLKGIEGCVVVSAEAELVDDGDGHIDAWPTLIVRDPNNGNVEFKVEVGADREGNGPGFLFGLGAPSWC
jgi:hypothetical protein